MVSMVKNPNWQEVDQLAIYKRGQGVELRAAEKQLQLAIRAGLEPGTSGFQGRHPNYKASLKRHLKTYNYEKCNEARLLNQLYTCLLVPDTGCQAAFYVGCAEDLWHGFPNHSRRTGEQSWSLA